MAAMRGKAGYKAVLEVEEASGGDKFVQDRANQTMYKRPVSGKHRQD